MGRPAIQHNNQRVHRFFAAYFCSSELCEEHPAIDDIFSGVLVLKSAGKSSTRTLSRSTLFHILQHCPCINVVAADEATHGRYAYSTLAEYAAVARVASKAIESYLSALPPSADDKTLRQLQQEIDAPYAAELGAADRALLARSADAALAQEAA